MKFDPIVLTLLVLPAVLAAGGEDDNTAEQRPYHHHLRGKATSTNNEKRRILTYEKKWDESSVQKKRGVTTHGIPLGANGLPDCFPSCYKQVQEAVIQNAMEKARASMRGNKAGVVVDQIDEFDITSNKKAMHYKVYVVSSGNGEEGKEIPVNEEDTNIAGQNTAAAGETLDVNRLPPNEDVQNIAAEIDILNQPLEDANNDGIIQAATNSDPFAPVDVNRLPAGEEVAEAPAPDLYDEIDILYEPLQDANGDGIVSYNTGGLNDANRLPGDGVAEAPEPDLYDEIGILNEPLQDANGDGIVEIANKLPYDLDLDASTSNRAVARCSVDTWPLTGNGVGYECDHDYDCKEGCCAITNQIIGNRRCVSPNFSPDFNLHCRGDPGNKCTLTVSRSGDPDDAKGLGDSSSGDALGCNTLNDCKSGEVCAFNPPSIVIGSCFDSIPAGWKPKGHEY